MLKIYLSSTLDDLEEHRANVKEALRKDGHLVVDSYGATPNPTVEQCLKDIDSCDIYVGLFAWRYGWEPPGENRSITESEYLAAQKSGKPCLVFMRPLEGWPANLTDLLQPKKMERVQALRNLVGAGTHHTSNLFTDPSDLAGKVSWAVSKVETEWRERDEASKKIADAPVKQGIMSSTASPHAHLMSTGLLLLGARGADDPLLRRLCDAMPAAWQCRQRSFAPEADAELPAIDAQVMRARSVALLVTPASLPRLRQSDATRQLLQSLEERMSGVQVLTRDLTRADLPAEWPVKQVFPMGEWLDSPAAGVGGQLADLQAALPDQETDLTDHALVALAYTTIAMTGAEARALAGDPEEVRRSLGDEAHRYFVSVTGRMTAAEDDWTKRYGDQRGHWRPFGNRKADDLMHDGVTRLNGQRFLTRQDQLALLGNRVRLRNYPFDPARMEDGTPAAGVYEGMRSRGCLVLIDELSMLHPSLRWFASGFVSDSNVSVVTLSPLDPSASALDKLASAAGPFNIGSLVDRFGIKLDPRCELSINSGARLRRWLRMAIPETLAVNDFQTADPSRRDAVRNMAYG